MGSTRDVPSEAGTAYTTGAPEFIPGFGRCSCCSFSVLFSALVNCVCHVFYVLFTSVLSFSVDLWLMIMSWYLLTSFDEINYPDTKTAIQRKHLGKYELSQKTGSHHVHHKQQELSALLMMCVVIIVKKYMETEKLSTLITRMCSAYRNLKSVLSSFMTSHRSCIKSSTTDATSGAVTVDLPEHLSFP